jgi:5'-3' exonuclease
MIQLMSQVLIFDLSNLAYISAYRYRQQIEQTENKSGEIYQSCVKFMRELYRLFSPEKVLFACDHPSYWRTRVFPDYKAHREDFPLKRQVREAIAQFKQQNAHLCLEVPECEADDVIFGLTTHLPGKKIIVSSDRDFLQLVREDVRLFNPMQMQFRAPEKKPDFELFVKCFRGDKGDNIPSAYPRITKKVLQSAFNNDNIFNSVMQTRLQDGVLVQEKFQLNKTLIDFSCIPEDIKQILAQKVALLGS